MTMTTTAPARAGTNTKQKVGLVICALYGLTNVPSVFFPRRHRRPRTARRMAILVLAASSG